MGVTLIIQARMGSARLPGKSMAKIDGLPMIHHIIARSLLVDADAVILATTDQPIDDVLADYARSAGIEVVRGSEDDVLSRFMLAIESEPRNDIIVRVCGDSPLFDPTSINECIETMIRTDADLVLPDPSVPSAYHGAEVISRRALEWTASVASPDDKRAHEHVTAYAIDHAYMLATEYFAPEPALRGACHLSVDTEDDLEMARRIYKAIPHGIVDLRDAVALVRS